MFRIFLGFLLSIFCLHAIADDDVTTTTTVDPDTNQTTITEVNPTTQETTTTIVTPTPAPKEVVNIPEGYTSCTTVPAGWQQSVWVPEHKVCQYTSTADKVYEGVGYVDGYWQCTKFKASDCITWNWVSGHWVNTID